MILPCHRTPEEKDMYTKLQAYMEEEKHYEKQRQKINQKAKEHKIEFPIAPEVWSKIYHIVSFEQ
ncbi:hypothetical protein D3C81_2034400 [compost metagenome]|nr:hypothetical protein [Paenibacillus sp. 1182]